MRGGVSRKSPLHSQTASVHPGSACVTPSAGEDSQATGVSEEEEGQEEGRRKKHLTRQILPAVPRARAAFQGVVGPDDLQEFPSHLKPFCSSGVTAVTSRAVSYHRREKVAPGFKAIPSACCFTPAAALLKKRRRKLWLTKLCHNRDCSRQHHGMLIMTSTGLAELSFSPLLAVDLQWSLIRGKRLYNSKWSYKADAPPLPLAWDASDNNGVKETQYEMDLSCILRGNLFSLPPPPPRDSSLFFP
ncbi:uncharacterized protein LOC141945019 [Strix uralensis]|uniref:uncharacterized protein LOC141945019 n=1 Tax=Strix uralensis TaxID=36305 RepID=UPI003DA79363